MSGRRWTYIRRFRALNFWTRLSLFLGAGGLFLAILFGIWSIFLAYNPPVQLTKEEETIIVNSGGNSEEVTNLLQVIQEERNESIDDIEQKDFIKIISNIYRKLDSTTKIELNKTKVDSISGIEYRSDVVIQKQIFGSNIKILLRLNPFNNSLGKTEILSFQKHIEIENATKGIIISKGKYTKKAFNLASNYSIDLAVFKSYFNLDWNNELKIPVIVKKIFPEVDMQFTFVIPENMGGLFSDHMISNDNGKNFKPMIQLFCEEWNNKKLYEGEVQKGILKIPDNNWVIETTNSWMTISNIQFVYNIKEEYRFKYLIPDRFIKLDNQSTDKLIYSEYLFKNVSFDSVSNWDIVNLKNSKLFEISEKITLTGIEILESKNFTTDNYRFRKNNNFKPLIYNKSALK